MKNETRGFIFLILSVACFCTHQICDKLWWIAVYMGTIQPTTESIRYGGIGLFVLSIVFFIVAIIFFIRTFKRKSEGNEEKLSEQS